MKCPTCTDERLVMTERSGIEIDYCPTCRGVWLDRGELDKIIERSTAVAPAATLPPPAGPAPISTSRVDDRSDRYISSRPRQDDRYDGERFDGDRYGSDRYDDRYDDRHDDGTGGKRRPRKKRESLLSELFDF